MVSLNVMSPKKVSPNCIILSVAALDNSTVETAFLLKNRKVLTLLLLLLTINSILCIYSAVAEVLRIRKKAERLILILDKCLCIKQLYVQELGEFSNVNLK